MWILNKYVRFMVRSMPLFIPFLWIWVSLSKLRSMIVKLVCVVKCNTLLKVSFLCSYGSSLSVFIISQTSEPLPHLFRPPIITFMGLIFAKETVSYILQELNFARKITFCHIFWNKCSWGYNANYTKIKGTAVNSKIFSFLKKF